MSYGTLEPIAIVGMSGEFPGGPSLSEFWDNIIAGRDCISRFSKEELIHAGVDEQVVHDKYFIGAAGVLKRDPYSFDHRFFGFNKREASFIDPQQRLFLESSWKALEDAGIDPFRYDGRIGICGGMTTSTYALELGKHIRNIYSQDYYNAGLGTDKDTLCSRVAYKMNLKGPCYSVQTYCSTSLVAVHLACNSLRAGQSEIMLAGGVSIYCPQIRGYYAKEGGIFSARGKCSPFDANADGTIFGSGVGLVVLMPLSAAMKGGYRVYAEILGSATNNDGNLRAGFAAPSGKGQRDVMAAAWGAANVGPGTIGLIEAHGTGTVIGDPIEFSAVNDLLGQAHTPYCALGSVKGMIGHTDAAAGIAGLIKTVLSVTNAQIAPIANFVSLNPIIAVDNTALYIPRQTIPWPAGIKRIAGVSSFGIGGINAHVVVGQHSGITEKRGKATHVAFPISVKNNSDLLMAVTALCANVRSCVTNELEDASVTLQEGRPEFAHKLCVVATTGEEAARLLQNRLFQAKVGEDQATHLYAFCQTARADAGYYDPLQAWPCFVREYRALCNELRIDDVSASFSACGRSTLQLAITEYCCQLTTYKVLALSGISIGGAIGEGTGEIAASVLAGIIDAPTGAYLIACAEKAKAAGDITVQLEIGKMGQSSLEDERNTWLYDGKTFVCGSPERVERCVKSLQISYVPVIGGVKQTDDVLASPCTRQINWNAFAPRSSALPFYTLRSGVLSDTREVLSLVAVEKLRENIRILGLQGMPSAHLEGFATQDCAGPIDRNVMIVIAKCWEEGGVIDWSHTRAAGLGRGKVPGVIFNNEATNWKSSEPAADAPPYAFRTKWAITPKQVSNRHCGNGRLLAVSIRKSRNWVTSFFKIGERYDLKVGELSGNSRFIDYADGSGLGMPVNDIVAITLLQNSAQKGLKPEGLSKCSAMLETLCRRHAVPVGSVHCVDTSDGLRNVARILAPDISAKTVGTQLRLSRMGIERLSREEIAPDYAILAPCDTETGECVVVASQQQDISALCLRLQKAGFSKVILWRRTKLQTESHVREHTAHPQLRAALPIEISSIAELISVRGASAKGPFIWSIERRENDSASLEDCCRDIEEVVQSVVDSTMALAISKHIICCERPTELWSVPLVSNYMHSMSEWLYQTTRVASKWIITPPNEAMNWLYMLTGGPPVMNAECDILYVSARRIGGEAGEKKLPAKLDIPSGKSPPVTEPRVDAVCRITRRILANPDVQPTDNFFAIGGDSMQAIDLLEALRIEEGMEVDLASIATKPLQEVASNSIGIVKP